VTTTGRTFLAFDLGASSCRAVLGTEGGDGRVALEEISRLDNAPIARGDGLFWDIEGIWEWMVCAIAAAAPRAPAAIGIDSWSVDYGLLGADGQLLEQPRCYRDVRNRGMSQKLAARIPLRELFLRNGLMAEDFTTLCQLIAAREGTPDLIDRARRLLFIPDLLRLRLCGVEATDLTLATTSQMFDIRSGRWDGELLGALGLPSDILPTVIPSSSVLSVLERSVRNRTGAGPVPVVTGASHDTAAAFSTVPRRKGAAALSSGTWSILGIHMDAPVWSAGIDPLRIGYEGNTDGSVRLVANIPGMWIIEQCRTAWKSRGEDYDYRSLVSGARLSRCSTAVDPYDPSFAAPPDMPEAVAAHLPVGERAPSDITRAVLLGLAGAYTRMVRELSAIAGERIESLTVMSGGSRNELLNEMIGERAGIRIEKGLVEATTVGNIMNQRTALAGTAKEAFHER
jgi:rhamnulokinase